MALDPTEQHEVKTSPMQLAHNPLFTAREKIDMLSELKAEVTSEHADPTRLGGYANQIDAAIAEIKLEVQEGFSPPLSLDGGRNEQHDD
jgi:hypothetical protein